MDFEFTDTDAERYGIMYRTKYQEISEAKGPDVPDDVLVGHACLHVVQEVLDLIMVELSRADEGEERES